MALSPSPAGPDAFSRQIVSGLFNCRTLGTVSEDVFCVSSEKHREERLGFQRHAHRRGTPTISNSPGLWRPDGSEGSEAEPG